MTDDKPNPSDPYPDAGPDGPNESEIERVLDEAAELADQLAAQYADSDTDSDLAEDDFEDRANPEEIDAELDDLQERLREIGAVTDAALQAETSAQGDEPAAPIGSPVAETAVAGDIAEGDDEPTSAASQSDTDLETEPKPAFVTDQADAGADNENYVRPALEAGKESIASPYADTGDFEEDVRAEDENTRNSAYQAPIGRSSRNSHRASRFTQWTARARSGGRTACQHVQRALSVTAVETMKTLDVMDRWFAWVSYDIRRVLGWLAMAMLVAAIVITAHSLS